MQKSHRITIFMFSVMNYGAFLCETDEADLIFLFILIAIQLKNVLKNDNSTPSLYIISVHFH